MPLDNGPINGHAQIRRLEDERTQLEKRLIEIKGYLVMYPRDSSYLRKKQEIEDMRDTLTKRTEAILIAHNQEILARVSY